MNRDDLRSVALKSPPAKRVGVEYEGVKFELLAPNLKKRNKIFKMSKSSNGDISLTDLSFWVGLLCTVVPGTSERVFEDTDQEAFENMQAGGYLDSVAPHTLELLNAKEDPKPSEPS